MGTAGAGSGDARLAISQGWCWDAVLGHRGGPSQARPITGAAQRRGEGLPHGRKRGAGAGCSQMGRQGVWGVQDSQE